MKIKELMEAELPRFKRGKAGCIPYIFDDDDDEVKMAFMITSDARYGGADPMIAKGGIDEGETPEDAGIREAEEELGLQRSNIISVERGWSGELSGLDRSYKFGVFICEVKSKNGFVKPGYETKEVVWLTLEEFKSSGRKSQVHIVEVIAGKIKQ